MAAITAMKMPKWGLSMEEGKVVHWWKAPGDRVSEGEDLIDIETAKITNTAEAPAAGVLRRIVAAADEILPVGALLAVIAEESASDEQIDRFVEDFQAGFTPEATEAEGEGELRLQTVRAGARELRVGSSSGEGSPIILIHGFAGDLGNWLFNVGPLGAAGPVIALDLPGHGASSKDVGDGSLTSLAGAVAAALDTLGIERAHLVGHSLGAAVAARLAADRPELALSLVLIAPAGLFGSAVSADFLDGLIAAERPRDLRPVLERLVADPAAISKDMVEEVVRYKRLDGVPEALGILRDRMLEGSDSKALQATAAALPAGLVIAGRADSVVGAPDEAALPPGWRMAWIEGAGHMPHMEKAAEVNRLIVETVRG